MTAAEVISLERESALDVHNRAMGAANSLKERYVELFESLLVVESRRIYLEFEIPSLYIYCVELLGLSRAQAHDLINVVRKSLEVPELATAIRSKTITIAKARKICSVLNPQNHKQWIDLATHCSCREIEKTVAMVNPKEAVAETMKYVSGEILEFKLGVTENWSELLTRTKDLLSQKEKRNVSSEEALFILMAQFCKKNDPVEKAERAQTLKENSAQGESSKRQSGNKARTRHRPAEAEHIIELRDQGQCAFVYANGERCKERRWIEKHHIVGFAVGGDHSPQNLITLCSGHHKIVHLRESPPQLVT